MSRRLERLSHERSSAPILHIPGSQISPATPDISPFKFDPRNSLAVRQGVRSLRNPIWGQEFEGLEVGAKAIGLERMSKFEIGGGVWESWFGQGRMVSGENAESTVFVAICQTKRDWIQHGLVAVYPGAIEEARFQDNMAMVTKHLIHDSRFAGIADIVGGMRFQVLTGAAAGAGPGGIIGGALLGGVEGVKIGAGVGAFFGGVICGVADAVDGGRIALRKIPDARQLWANEDAVRVLDSIQGQIGLANRLARAHR